MLLYLKVTVLLCLLILVGYCITDFFFSFFLQPGEILENGVQENNILLIIWLVNKKLVIQTLDPQK